MTNESIDTTQKTSEKHLVPRPYRSEKGKRTDPDRQVLTHEDYEQLPEGAPYQLIGGILVITPAPGVNHQRISRNLGFILNRFVAENNVGEIFFAPIDVQLSGIDVFQPDIIFIHNRRQYIIGEMKIQGAPDIVVEILSPSTGYYDLREKRDAYEKHGVREYWIVDPGRREIEVFVNHNEGFCLFQKAKANDSISSNVLEGFTVSVRDIF